MLREKKLLLQMSYGISCLCPKILLFRYAQHVDMKHAYCSLALNCLLLISKRL